VTAAQKKARASYIFFTLQAKKWLKVMQTTKYGNVYKNALRLRRLYNTVCGSPTTSDSSVPFDRNVMARHATTRALADSALLL
jgi:hypothetical protein